MPGDLRRVVMGAGYRFEMKHGLGAPRLRSRTVWNCGNHLLGTDRLCRQSRSRRPTTVKVYNQSIPDQADCKKQRG